MKRPFAVIGFTGFFALLTLFLCESTQGAYYALFAFTALGTATLFNKNLRQALTVPVCLFTGAAACFLFICHSAQCVSVQSLAGENVQVEATVYERPYIKKENARHYCILELEAVDKRKAKGKLRLSFSPSKDGIDADALEVGSRLSFTAKVYIPGEGEKSISRYFAGENIVLGAYFARDMSITPPKTKSAGLIFSQIRHLVAQRLRYGFSDKIAGLLTGMLTGDKSCLDGDLYNVLKKTGIAHLMAVSGFHLSLWVFSLGAFIPESDKTAKLKYTVLLFAVLFLMLLAGMSESVKRAGFMCVVHLLGKLSKRRSDSLNSLGFAAVLMILFNPACVLSISMQLSFLSTLGILTLGKSMLRLSSELFGGKRINTPLKKLLRSAADTFFISISVLVFTFPVMLYAFNGVSAVSAFVNVFVAPAAMPLLLLSGAYVLTFAIDFIAFPIAVILKLLAGYIIFTAELFAGLENAFIVFEPENIFLFAAGLVLVALMCLCALIKNFRSLTALSLCIAVSCTFIIADKFTEKDSVKIHLARCGDSVLAAVQRDNQAVLLNRAGEYEKGLFVSLLDKKGIALAGEVEEYARLFLKSAVNGKYIASAERLELFDDVTLSKKESVQCIELYEKDILIFYSGALQCDGNCDIMIKITHNDATLSIGESSFSLEDEGELTLMLTENKTVLRGKNQWLNLMKSS